MGNAKWEFGVIKKGTLSKEIKRKVEMDLRNSSVNSITKYSMPTIDRTKADGGKCENSQRNA